MNSETSVAFTGVISVEFPFYLQRGWLPSGFVCPSFGADNAAAAKTPDAERRLAVDFLLRCAIATQAAPQVRRRLAAPAHIG
jgi:hypothetical protein